MNAIDAMPAGGNLTVRARHLEGASQVQLQVGDDGAGISPELLPQLFEPFFTTKERGHSVGLGLAISHSIIERHQGRIEVASEPDRGTVFTITLPVHAAAPVHAGAAEAIQERGQPT
jgi:signal transduction histidine kinase